MIPYEKISLISEKENNKVWLASTKEPDTIIVVKEVFHANTDVLACIASISNPHIPHVLFWETTDHITTIAEEYISGLPLNSYIKENHLSEQEIINLLLQICDGIKVLHSQTPPIIHRDLKPSNILVSSDGIVKIIDFDAARKYNEKAATDTCHLGTAAFASPEHYGYSQTDARSDIYSLGAVMYELFFGKQLPKISAERTTATEWYDSTHKLPKKLIRIIEKCTMFNPSARYQNIEELQHALKNYANRPKRIFAACLTAVLATFFIIGSSVVLLGNPKNTTTTIFHPKTSGSDITLDAIPDGSPTDIEEMLPNSTPSKNGKKNQKAETTRTPSNIVPPKTASASATSVTPRSKKNKNIETTTKSSKNKSIANTPKSSKNKSIKSKKKNNKTESNNTDKKANKDSSTTAPKETSLPVIVDYSGKASYYIDTYNSKTGQSEMFTFYYLKNSPSLTPINVACGLLNNYTLNNVYIEDTSQDLTYAIPSKYWSLSYQHIVNISNQYLSTLMLNTSYKIILDCDNAIIAAKLKPISSLNQVAAPFNQYAISPGCMEYSCTNPTATTLAIVNGYGRKITKIAIPSSGKTVDSKYYTIDSKNIFITFKKSFFKDFSNGSSITLRVYHSQIQQIAGNNYTSYTFIAKNKD